ncbi:MAG: hypothetical protein JWO28_1015 [Hyphomicrobiales bacterium]|nr:hypothetical protein [Hyphomicrobiales bacterium]
MLAFPRPLFTALLLLICVAPSESYAQIMPTQIVSACERNKSHTLYHYSSVNSDWIAGGLGYHAVATVYCKKCDPANNASGLLWSGPSKGPYIKPDIEGMRRSLKALSDFMYTPFDKAELRGNPSQVRFAGFVGWQVKFDASKDVAGDVKRHDIIVVEAEDGCASIRLRIEAPASGKDEPVSAVKDLIAAIGMTKEEEPIFVKPPAPRLDFDEFQLWRQSKH